jgi:hypothetical protein
MADQYILFIKLASQIAYLFDIESVPIEIMELEMMEIEKYFFPVYDKIVSADILLPLYKGVYNKMRKHLGALLKEKSVLLKKRER